MVKSFKIFLIAASLTGLVACDSADKKAEESAPAPQATTTTETSTPAAAPTAPAASAFKGKEVVAADGKVTLQVPESYTEQAGASDALKIYADMAKQHTLLIISTPATGTQDKLKEMLTETQTALKMQDTNLNVVKQESIKAGNLDMEQMTVKMTASGQQVYSYTALGIVGNKQLTLQFTAPVSEEAAFQKSIDDILSSVNVK